MLNWAPLLATMAAVASALVGGGPAAAAPSATGSEVVATVLHFGDATVPGPRANAGFSVPAVAMAATPDGLGYWLATSGGNVYTFGDARFRGSLEGHSLSYPVVAMAATPDGLGYWLATSGGNVYTFGDARFRGSLEGHSLSYPVVAMAATPDGQGYWLVTSGGAVSTFGDARYYGGAPGGTVVEPVDGITATADDLGYWLVRGRRATADPFPPSLSSALAQRSGQVSAAVLDLRTGCLYTLNPGWEGVTASIVKVEILGTLLAQGRPLSAQQNTEAVGMIELSDNNDATALWDDAGGAPAVAAFDRSVDMTSTTPNVAWGLTTTTAADQVDLLLHLVEPNAVLSSASQAYELGLMENVTPYEAWGVTAGTVPGTTVALKNGWLPQPSGWEVNSIGWVDGADRDYLVAVLTLGSATEAYGIATVSSVSVSVWGALGPLS
jgi:Beta-lactamase enzyme family